MAGQQKTRVAEVGGSWAQDETRTYITPRPNITSSGYHCAPDRHDCALRDASIARSD